MGERPESTQKARISAVSRTIPPEHFNGVFEAKKRVAARKAALGVSPEFIANCAAHGSNLFDTATGACLSCLAEPSTLPDRLRYMNGYAVSYPARCEVHGTSLHDIANNRCLECYTRSGKARQGAGPNTARLAARSTGATSYMATCAIHGEHPHHTIRGKCLGCFNSLGYPRKR